MIKAIIVIAIVIGGGIWLIGKIIKRYNCPDENDLGQ